MSFRWERDEEYTYHIYIPVQYIKPLCLYSGEKGGSCVCVYCYTFCIFISAVCIVQYIHTEDLVVMQFNRISLRGNGAGFTGIFLSFLGWGGRSRGKTQ